MTWKKRWNFGWKLTKLHTTSTHLQMPRQKEIGRMRWHAHTAPLRSSRRSQRHHTNFLLDIPRSNIFSVLFIYNFNHSVFLAILKNIIFCLWYFTGWVFVLVLDAVLGRIDFEDESMARLGSRLKLQACRLIARLCAWFHQSRMQFFVYICVSSIPRAGVMNSSILLLQHSWSSDIITLVIFTLMNYLCFFIVQLFLFLFTIYLLL